MAQQTGFHPGFAALNAESLNASTGMESTILNAESPGNAGYAEAVFTVSPSPSLLRTAR